jgi:hypothetical protein
MINVQDLIRSWCESAGYPLPDLKGRARAAREAGLISQKGFGRYAADATVKDGAMLLLSILSTQFWKDVPAGIERYRNLVLSWATYSSNPHAEFDAPFGMEIGKTSLLDALMKCLELCAQHPKILEPLSLQIVRSDINPAAFLALRLTEGGAVPGETVSLRFVEPRLPFVDQPREAFTIKGEVHDFALSAMAQLLAHNIAAQNKHDTSAPTDMSFPSDESPRTRWPGMPDWIPDDIAARLGRSFHRSHLCERHGGLPGEFPLPPMEPSDEDCLDVYHHAHHADRDARSGPPVAGANPDRGARPDRPKS